LIVNGQALLMLLVVFILGCAINGGLGLAIAEASLTDSTGLDVTV
jgi:hypothetical protein